MLVVEDYLLILMGINKTSKQIAELLLFPKTVEGYRIDTIQKLGLDEEKN